MTLAPRRCDAFDSDAHPSSGGQGRPRAEKRFRRWDRVPGPVHGTLETTVRRRCSDIPGRSRTTCGVAPEPVPCRPPRIRHVTVRRLSLGIDHCRATPNVISHTKGVHINFTALPRPFPRLITKAAASHPNNAPRDLLRPGRPPPPPNGLPWRDRPARRRALAPTRQAHRDQGGARKIFLDTNILVGEYFGPWNGSPQHSGTRRGGASWNCWPSGPGRSANWPS